MTLETLTPKTGWRGPPFGLIDRGLLPGTAGTGTRAAVSRKNGGAAREGIMARDDDWLQVSNEGRPVIDALARYLQS